MIPTLAEEEVLHDGEPVFAMAWGEGPAEPHGLPDGDRLGSSRAINRNIAGFSTVTPGASNLGTPRLEDRWGSSVSAERNFQGGRFRQTGRKANQALTSDGFENAPKRTGAANE